MSQGHTAYKRFMILAQPRTGSTLLAESLNSNPNIRCFGEIFNFLWDAIDYRVEGYDIHSAEDLALRSTAPDEFLRRRIFCEHPAVVRAVGFKFHYQHYMAAEGLWQQLQKDDELAVIHLQRRNLLRVLTSDKIAERTGVYELKSKSGQGSMKPGRIVRAIRQRLRRMTTLRATAEPAQPSKVTVHIQPDELRKILHETELSLAHWATLFGSHPMITLAYEDMVVELQETFASVQTFLGLQPRSLAINLVRQNPEPLAKLIDNFDELYDEFRGTLEEWMLQD